MQDVEILAYSPINMEKFEEYVKTGLKKPNGEPEIDRHGRFVTGVIAWLNGRLIPEAQFFSSPPESPIKVFVATIRPPDNEDEKVPWMSDVPALEDMVTTDGLLGTVAEFTGTIKPGTASPLGWVERRTDLEEIFNKQRDTIAELDFSRLNFTKEEFLGALQGNPGTNLPTLLSDIQAELETTVIESPAKAVATKTNR